MFQKVVAAYNESPEAERALISAIRLTKIMNGDLQAITVMADLPAYTAFASVGDPSLPHELRQIARPSMRMCKRRLVHLLSLMASNSTPTWSRGMAWRPSWISYERKRRISWSSVYTSAISTYRGYGALSMNWHRKRPVVFSGFTN
jgi:hypothetical protein